MNEQENTSLHVEIKKNGEAEIRVVKAKLPEIIRLCRLTIEVSCRKYLSEAEKEDQDLRDAMASDMFELINVGASTLLNKLFPEIVMRPDLTTEAILEAENKIIEEQPKFVKKAHEAYLRSADFAKDKAISDANKALIKAEKEDNMACKKKKKK